MGLLRMTALALVVAVLASSVHGDNTTVCESLTTAGKLRRVLWAGNRDYDKHTRPALAMATDLINASAVDIVKVRVNLLSVYEVDTAKGVLSVLLITDVRLLR